MSGRPPAEIWDQGADEGERRLSRSATGLIATGVVGGVDIKLGILALVVAEGGLLLVMPEGTAHLLASTVFGIGLVFLVIGRSELFTENFLLPVSAVIQGRKGTGDLWRLWLGTLIGNLAGLILLALALTRAGLVPPEALDAGGSVAETFAERGVGAAFLSAVIAGTVLTLMTWLLHAVDSGGGRIAIAMLVGFLLAAPSLNHAVVSVGEMSFGILAGTGKADWDDLGQNFPVAVIGNLVGGLAFVTLARLVQVRGEPEG
jgi:formate/nitrite transporter FocA (FNT family)